MGRRARWDDVRKGRLAALWNESDKSVRLIADELDTSAGCIYAMARLELMRDHYDRVAMRISGGGYETDCSEVVDRAEDAIGVRCPAETDADRSCATCALCMQTNRTISFVRH